MKFKGLLFLIFFLVFIYKSNSQLQLQLKLLTPETNINSDDFPVLKCDVKAIYNGNQVALQKESVYITEGVFTSKAIDVSSINSEGWQTIKWIPEQFEFDSNYRCLIFGLHQNVLGRQLGYAKLKRVPYSIVTDQDHQQIRDIFWEDVQPGNAIPYQIRFKGQIDVQADDGPYSMTLDSITTNTKYFQIKWIGSDSDFDRRPPPRTLRVGSYYWVNVIFKPEENKYYQDILTLHYEGGLKRFVPLYGNSFTVNTKNLIELVSPNGGEILTPCQYVDIKWKGHSPEFPTEVYYSPNAGFSWYLIANVRDSIFSWRVPDVQSESVLLKVRQNFNQSKVTILGNDRRSVNSLGYNKFGTLLTSVNERGKVQTFDLANTNPPEQIRQQFLGADNESEYYYSFGMEYSPFDSIYYVGYRRTDLPGYLIGDTIAVLSSNQTNPIRKITLPNNTFANSMTSDLNRQFIAVTPSFGNQVFIYSGDNLTLLRTLNFKSQIMDFAFNSETNEAVVLLIDGDIEILSMPDFNTKKELHFNNFPNFVKVALSPNGKLLSIGSKADNTGLKNNTYVIDLETERIVRVFTPSMGDPIGLNFNPSSSTLVIGSVSDMQIAFYDLTISSSKGSLFGHYDRMTDIKLSPNGHSLASSALSSDNIVYRSFVYPEEDRSDDYLAIHKPVINLDQINIQQAYLGTQNQHLITTICNQSDVFADFESGYFKFNEHFQLSKPWERDSLFPGECTQFTVNFNPLDTGLIRDTLILRNCNTDYKIPFEAYSIPRNIAFLSNNYDFGEVCIGDTSIKNIAVLRNDDPVPLKVNYYLVPAENSKVFSAIIPKADTLIPPGGILDGIVRFVPDTLGIKQTDITIYHSDQKKINTSFKVKGKGIGSFVSVSHDNLVFIPEILQRELKITNVGLTDIFFEDISTVPPDNYKVLTQTPFTLKAGESTNISIEWNGINENAVLKMEASPCLVQKFINLKPYQGSSEIIIANVETSAKNENLEIPVTFKNNENYEYKGIRFFEAELNVNPKIFLPIEVLSDYGEAKLLSNSIISNERIFKLRVTGDFNKEGTVAVIKGVAGLTDTNFSLIKTQNTSAFWGKAVNTLAKDGSILITDIWNDRYVKDIAQGAVLKNILPNPASDHIIMEFEAFSNEPVRIEVLNNLGETMFNISNFIPVIGKNNITIKTDSFSIGNYKLNILTGSKASSAGFIILR